MAILDRLPDENARDPLAPRMIAIRSAASRKAWRTRKALRDARERAEDRATGNDPDDTDTA